MSRLLLLSLLPLLLLTAAVHGGHGDGYALVKTLCLILVGTCVGSALTMLADYVISHFYGRQRDGSNGEVEIQGNGQSSGNVLTTESQHQGHDGSDNHFVTAPLATATLLGDRILLIVMLCFQSFFEGIAIGIMGPGSYVWKALLTFSLPKVFGAVAMGITPLRVVPDRPLLSCAAYAFAFAISGPIGAAIGTIIDSTTQGVVAGWIFSISEGLASGMFIYVLINHLLPKGSMPQKLVLLDTPLYKFFAVLLGIGVIASVVNLVINWV